MPNLVGIGNSQVPTNAMLGGLAYQDPAHANLTSVEIENIAAIKAKMIGTAVDVFVYDTRKDSDGGAWRKRTQHTSWYNEAAGAYRGERKEFPAVAVIVASTSGLTIYDADDPNLSMWMVIVKDNDNWLKHTASGPNSVVALNGNVVSCGGGNPGRLSVINFVSDDGYVTEPGYTYRHYGIANRNSTGVGGADPNDTVNPRHIVNITCNDVAITVLPNAPIDSSTGLPIPTIAVATDGGVSVIKDDGSVVDIKRTSDDDVHHVAFDDDRVIMFMELGAIYVATIPSADQSGNPNAAWSVYGSGNANTSGTDHPTILGVGAGADLVSMKDYTFANAGYNSTLDQYKGLSILDQNLSSSGNGMVAWIKSTFNTGWMHGDIKGAYLAETDDTAHTGNVITNGSFATVSDGQDGYDNSDGTVDGWQKNGNSSLSINGNALRFTQVSNGSWQGGNAAYAMGSVFVVGKTYSVKYKVRSSGNGNYSQGVGARIQKGSSWHSSNTHAYKETNSDPGTSWTTIHWTWIAEQDNYGLEFYNWYGVQNSWIEIDDIEVKEAVADRSYNNVGDNRSNRGGLYVQGTVNKTAVATGAELVAYSNFSGSNYLFQPYNSNLDFTTTMSIMLWVKGWQASDSLLHRGPGGTRNSKTSFHLYCSYDYNYRITFTTNGSTEQSYSFGHSANLDGWHHVCFTLSGGTVKGFRNGVERTMSSTSFSGNIFSQATDKNGLYVGTGPVGGSAEPASIALLKLSSTVPSAEQVKKIYHDEKQLFQENAKCTLYGTSNQVEAVAYDDSNDILHAGTSAGRSEFVGLNRINNTTTAVTTAISASNGIVAEQ